MRQGLGPHTRVVLLCVALAAAFLAVSSLGTLDDPYAANEWLFSHTFLAQRAIETGEFPFNIAVVVENEFSETHATFEASTGLDRMTFYATTIWHFWNGLPLQPALVATLASMTSLSPEEVARIPVGGIGLVLLAFATADLVMGWGARRGALLAPCLLIFATAPLALDLRVMMPSVSVIIIGLMTHFMIRRQLRDDKLALAMVIAPVLLLPFWYYTVAYFVMIIFAGFLVAAMIGRMTPVCRRPTPVLPIAVIVLVPVLLGTVLTINGALTSHLNMASDMLGGTLLSPEPSSDYSSHLNRDAWRSVILYASLVMLFIPLGAVAWRSFSALLRGRPSRDMIDPMFAQWVVGAVIFSLVMVGTVGVSFLNRTVIYLAPVAAIVAARATSPVWDSRLKTALLMVGVVIAAGASSAIIATATPQYVMGDQEAFEWIAENVPHDAVIYGSLETSSVLLRVYGFTDAVAYHPRLSMLNGFWYSKDVDSIAPYLPSFEYFVLRDDAVLRGFEEFGPLRDPISAEAYAKFAQSRDLALIYDNEEVKVFRTAIQPERLAPFERDGAR